MKVKKIGIAGSTGSIGTQTLDVVRAHGELFRLECLTTFSNETKLIEQCNEFKPQYCGLIKGSSKSIYCNSDAYDRMLEYDLDILVVASNGLTAIPLVISALNKGIRVALANKETLVAAGELINRLPNNARQNLIPIDSEHSAIFQCLNGYNGIKDIDKLVLTASGGPFFGTNWSNLNKVSAVQALSHPKWKMGKKITVDSATMMNKGLEIIEASRLFNMDEKSIEVLIHPQCIVHSFVSFRDGSSLAQLSEPDMRIAISYALSYPDRIQSSSNRLNLADQSLQFFNVPTEMNKCILLSRQALKAGGLAPTILTSANDVCVNAFLQNRISFLDIEKTVEMVMNTYKNICNDLSVENIFATQESVKKYAESIINSRCA